MITPLHIATVGGHPLRFFKTPLDDGRPDFSWHCVDDLHRCIGRLRAIDGVARTRTTVVLATRFEHRPTGTSTPPSTN